MLLLHAPHAPLCAGDEEEEDDDDDDDGEFGPGELLGYDEYGMPVLASEYDSEEDSDYESEGGLRARVRALGAATQAVSVAGLSG